MQMKKAAKIALL